MPFNRNSNSLIRQVIVFGFVGIASTAINYILFLSLVYAGINYILSAALGFITGVLFGFWFNKNKTFRSISSVKSTLPLYILVYLVSLFFNLSWLYLLVTYFNTNKIITNIVLAPIIILLNFLGTKILVFKNKIWS